MKTTVIKGHEIPTDSTDCVCMTELWRLAGKPKDKKPSYYKGLVRARKWLCIARWYATHGRASATWADLVLALDYAEYLGLACPNPKPFDADEWLEDARRRAKERAAARQDDTARQEAEEWEEFRRKIRESIEESERQLQELREGSTAGEEWKRGTEYDETIVNRCAAYTMGLDDLNHLFFDFLEAGEGEIRIRASVN